MLLFNANKNSQGFTLIETLTVVIIVGILAAISAPSFLGLLNRSKVNSAINEVRGALQEAQREAIRKSKSCTVTLNTVSSPHKVTGSCLITGERNLEGVNIRSENSSITFFFRGGTNISNTIVVSLPNSTVAKQKCLVIASGIALMRSGNYDDNDTTGTDPNNCTTSQ